MECLTELLNLVIVDKEGFSGSAVCKLRLEDKKEFKGSFGKGRGGKGSFIEAGGSRELGLQ